MGDAVVALADPARASSHDSAPSVMALATPLRVEEEPDCGPYGLELALHDAFFFMERRRIQRQAGGGRMVQRGLVTFGTEVAMFFGVGLYGLTSVRMKVFGSPDLNLRYLGLPICLSVWILGMALHEALGRRENVPLVWAKTWGWLLVIWALWVYEPDTSSCAHHGEEHILPFYGDDSGGEVLVFTSFAVLETLTLLYWIVLVKLHLVVIKRCCFGTRALRWHWQIRSARNKGEGWMSYLPNGCCCACRRFHFQYEGEKDAQGRPHGLGVWRDDSHHGEVLEGDWYEGRPTKGFMSRIVKSHALSLGLEVGYGTARAEQLTQLFLCPRRSGRLRCGILQVECSAAGGFLSHLPQSMQHRDFADADGLADAAGMLSELQQAGAVERLRISRNVSPESTFGAPPPPDDAPLEQQAGPPLATWPGAPGGRFLERSTSCGSQASAAGAALVFVHGYNCPLDWACMRMGQLMALGKFPPTLTPLVFSWPSGGLAAYFQARNQLSPDAAGSVAPDFVEFLRKLREAGLSSVHIIAHSMGCELVCAALPLLRHFVSESQQFSIPTVTFFNATCSREAFLAPEGELSQLLAICARLTLYNDGADFALTTTEVIGGRGRVIGRHTKPLPRDCGVRREDRARVDIVDCTSMDANVGGVRHNYFNLQPHIVGDLQEMVCRGKSAAQRSRLVRISMDPSDNIFAFLAPPAFVSV